MFLVPQNARNPTAQNFGNMTRCNKSLQFLVVCCCGWFNITSVWSFTPLKHSVLQRGHSSTFHTHRDVGIIDTNNIIIKHVVGGKGSDSDDMILPSEKDQLVLGVVGTKMSLVMLLSEYVLKTTGCGLPAGPYGIVGAIEGISYLGVTSFVALSLYCKLRTGAGLPSGPKGILGLAEGMSYLAAIIGILVLVYQVIDFGYIPNAVPMEGGMCQ